MPKKDDAHALRTAREFISYAERNGCEIIYGRGSHVKVRNELGIAIIPNHTGDIPPGTRRSIIKAFVIMGIAILVLVILLMIGL